MRSRKPAECMNRGIRPGYHYQQRAVLEESGKFFVPHQALLATKTRFTNRPTVLCSVLVGLDEQPRFRRVRLVVREGRLSEMFCQSSAPCRVSSPDVTGLRECG